MSDQELISWYMENLEIDSANLDEMSWDLSADESLTIARHLLSTMPSDTAAIYLYLPTLEVLPAELAGFPDLKELEASATALVDTSVLHRLEKLEHLSLTQTTFTSFKDIGSIPNLKRLYIEQGAVTSWEGIDAFPKLEFLNASNSQLSGTVPEGFLSHIETLLLSNTHVSALQFPVGKDCRLKKLNLKNTPVLTLSGVEQCQLLVDVTASGTGITTFDDFADLRNLVELNLANTQITEVTSASNLPALKWLDMSETQLETLDGMEKFQNLCCLYVYETKVSDLTPVQNLVQLRYLGITGTSAAKSAQRSEFEAKGVNVPSGNWKTYPDDMR